MKNLISFALVIIVIGLTIFTITKNPSVENAVETNLVSNVTESAPLTPVVKSENTNSNNLEKTKMEIDTNIDYKANIVTSMGTIKIDLFEKETPITVNNFVTLANKGFFDGLIFHRVIVDFMIQGGDPTGTGSGGPGYNFEDEITGKPIVKGTLAMANSGPNTNGSQFFIVTATETPWLNNLHTNFGVVVEGQEVVDAISMVEKDANDKPLTSVTINKIEIIAL